MGQISMKISALPGSVLSENQQAAKAAGYDPARFGGHSLRAGFVTAAARAGASIFRMKDVSRHKSTDVLATYIREEQIFHHHAGDGFL
jgi:integrase